MSNSEKSDEFNHSITSFLYKNMKKSIIALSMAVAGLAAQAQELRTTYFMETSTYRHEMNPAYLDSSYVAMPLILGNLNLGTTGNLGLTNFVYEMQPSWQGYGVDGRNLTTFMHPAVSAKDFLDGLKGQNRFSFNFKYQLFGVAFKAFGGTNLVEGNIRANVDMALPKSMFEFMKTAGERADYDISDLGVKAESFFELALGHSRRIDDKLDVGAKAKLLFGLGRGELSADNLHLHMSDDYWKIQGDVDASAALMNSTLEFEDASKNDPATGRPRVSGIDEFKGGLSGFGLAFDLGATYQLLPELKLSASITDLGFIAWSNTHKATSKGEWTFDGFKEDVYAGGTNTGTNKIGDQMDAISDDLEEIFSVYYDGKGSQTKALAATLNLGAEYTLPAYDKLRFGFLYTSRFAGKYSWHEGMFSATVRPIKWFEASANFAAHSGGVSGGLVVDFHAPHFNFFIGADRIMGKVSKDFIPLNNTNTSLSMGMSFPL